MAGTKPGFMMYHNHLRILSKMDAESFKKMILAMCDYSEHGTEPVDLEVTELVLFEMFREILDRDNATYNARVKAGASGGQKSGESRRSKSKQTEANRSEGKQAEASQSEIREREANEPTSSSISSSTSISTSSSISKNPSDSSSSEEEEFPPTREMVERFAREKGLDVDAGQFIAECSKNGWRDNMGRRIVSWRMWLNGYVLKHAKREVQSVDPRIAALEALKGGG